MSAFYAILTQHLASNLEYALIGRREQYQEQQNLIRVRGSKRLPDLALYNVTSCAFKAEPTDDDKNHIDII